MLEPADRVRERPGGVVLLPSAFMQNFLRPHPMATRSRADGEILTSAGDGRVGWIDADDIAAAAAALLSDPEADHDDEYLLTGPRALGYRDAAAIITAGTGRAIRVHREERISTSVLDLTGRAPRDFADFVRRHASEWATRTTSP